MEAFNTKTTIPEFSLSYWLKVIIVNDIPPSRRRDRGGSYYTLVIIESGWAPLVIGQEHRSPQEDIRMSRQI
jgi:hypothetical protein